MKRITLAALGTTLLLLACSKRQVAEFVIDQAAAQAGVPMQTRMATDLAFRMAKGGVQYARSHQDITPSQEFYLGRTVAAHLFQQYPHIEDIVATSYLAGIGLTLAQASPRPEVYGGYHFAIVDSEHVNAVTCPAGLILISRGTLDFVRSEDELAAILAHELAHAALKHPLQAIQDVNSVPILSGEAFLETVNDYTGLVDLTQAFTQSVDSISVTLMETGYDKEHEFAADELALLIMHDAGYDPTALVALLERLPVHDGFSKTHPSAEQRVVRLRGVIEQFQLKATPKIAARSDRFASVAAKLPQGRPIPARHSN